MSCRSVFRSLDYSASGDVNRRLILVRLFGAVHFSLLVATPDGLALVVFALAFCQGQQNFDFSVFKIDPDGYQRMALFIDFAVESFNFVFVQEQFARP